VGASCLLAAGALKTPASCEEPRRQPQPLFRPVVVYTDHLVQPPKPVSLRDAGFATFEVALESASPCSSVAGFCADFSFSFSFLTDDPCGVPRQRRVMYI